MLPPWAPERDRLQIAVVGEGLHDAVEVTPSFGIPVCPEHLLHLSPIHHASFPNSTACGMPPHTRESPQNLASHGSCEAPTICTACQFSGESKQMKTDLLDGN